MPIILAPHLMRTARDMLRELRQAQRVIVLVPAPRPTHAGHKIRVVEQQLPEWYIRLLGFSSFRRNLKGGGWRMQSNFKRPQILRSLERIADGKAMQRRNSIDSHVIEIVEREHRVEMNSHAG